MAFTITEPNLLVPVAAETQVQIVLRRQGIAMDLPVTFTLAGLPTGVTADPLTVAPDGWPRTHAKMVVRAAPGADIDAPHRVQVTASAAGMPPATAALQFVDPGYPGTLDLAFGEGGIRDLGLPLGSEVRSVRRDGSRFIVRLFVGSFWSGATYLARVSRDGVLDAAFGEGGLRKLPADCASGYGATADFEVLGDGRILTVGQISGDTAAGSDVVVCRFNSDGEADDSFGEAGRVQVDFGERSVSPRVLFVRGNSIWVGGQSAGMFLLKLHSNGSIDTTFGGDGKAFFSFGDGDNLSDIWVNDDGSILGVGNKSSSGGVYRLGADGSVDMTFGSGGTAVMGCVCREQRIAVDPSGRFLVSGATSCDGYGYGVTRLLSDGSRDPAFGTDGCVREGGYGSQANEVVFVDESPLVAGAVVFPEHTSSVDLALVRYTVSGARDTSFGAGGVFRKYIGSLEVCGGLNERLVSVTPRADGRATAIGIIGGRAVMMRIWL